LAAFAVLFRDRQVQPTHASSATKILMDFM